MTKNVKITLVRSLIGCTEKNRRIVRGLSLGKTQSSTIKAATPEVLGMINKIPHLLKVEETQ